MVYHQLVAYTLNILRLIRLQNCLLAALATLVGGYLQTLEPQLTDLYLMAVISALICGAGNALNDRLDVASDKINHPSRPLPSGALKTTEASLVALMLGALGLLLSLALSPSLMALVALATGALVWYNYRLKRVAVFGNLMVAFLGALTVVAGGMAAGGNIFHLPGVLFPATLAFLIHFAREMTKDIEDIEGDKTVGFATYPIRQSVKLALNVASATVALLVILTLAPAYLGWYTSLYTYTVILAVDVPLVVILILLNVESKPRTLRTASLVYKLGMVMGLVAIYLGGILPS